MLLRLPALQLMLLRNPANKIVDLLALLVIKEPLLWQEFFGKAVNRRLTVFPKNLMNERRNQHE